MSASRLALLVSSLLLPVGPLPTGRGHEVARSPDLRIRFSEGPFTLGPSPAALAQATRLCRSALPADSCDFSSEGPERRVWLAAFELDRLEVSVARYRECVDLGACAPDPLLVSDRRFIAPQLPVTSITWDEAVRYCAYRGARLPTSAEWSRAASGRSERVWPWGNAPEERASNHGAFVQLPDAFGHLRATLAPDLTDGFGLLSPVGSFPAGASQEGVLDLAGNAAEWVADWARGEEAPTDGQVNPQGPAHGLMRVVRGGSFRHPLLYQRTTALEALPPSLRAPEVGFRCARSTPNGT